MCKTNILIAMLAILIDCSSAYRILCPYPTNSRSHFIVADALFKGLAAKGHDVTVISGFPPEHPILNYRHIQHEIFTNHDEIMKMMLKKPGDMDISSEVVSTMIQISVNESRSMLQNPKVQEIMREESFDLVIIEFLGMPHSGLAAHFNCSMIMFASVKPLFSLLESVGNPLALSYVPHPLYAWTDFKHFKDRLYNFMIYLFEHGINIYVTQQFSIFHTENFPAPKYPSLEDIITNNVAAIFVTHHFSQGDVRPIVPGLIEISGIQMTETATPLPDTLQSWMDQSTNGVIFFSLGSNLKVSSFSPDMLQAVINVFRQLKQNVLWKSDLATIPGLPANVRLEKWVSQVDVLQHKNLRLFITHGGFGSVTESKFYGIPLLVIPMFADQIPNADRVKTEGWGVKLLYDEFTEQRLYNSLNEVLENPKYLYQARHESMLFRDRPLTPLQTGIFWVEYAIRHKGARHMRSNVTQLNWFQVNSLDVIGFLSAVFIVLVYVSYKVVKCLVKKTFGTKKTKRKLN